MIGDIRRRVGHTLFRLTDGIQGRDRIHFLHVRKTGGTAIKEALSTLPGFEKDGCSRKSKDSRLLLHNHSWRLSDIPEGEPCFFFVRDPKTRFASGFYSRKRKGQPRHFNEWSKGERRAFSRFDTHNDLASALSSGDPSRRQAARDAMGEINHVSHPLTTWLRDPAYLSARREDILFVGSQENLNADFQKLKKHLTQLDLPDHVALPEDTTKAHRNPRASDYTFEPEAERNLREWYAPDYRLLARLADWFDHLPAYE